MMSPRPSVQGSPRATSSSTSNSAWVARAREIETSLTAAAMARARAVSYLAAERRACWDARFSFFAARFSLTERPGFFFSPAGLDFVAIGAV
jgi:hypothetical protein